MGELQVDGRGRVARIEVEDGDGDDAPLARCIDRLRTFRAMPLGCRWKATVSLGSYGL